jgi:glycosyltransferase involved in cell wall biosynthesis
MPESDPMSGTALVSIVLPTLNGSRYIELALDALIAQTYTNWELIFVDGGSTDGTQAIIDSYCARDARMRQVRDAQGLNLPASLNRGFREVKGEYLAWISDDNVYRPNAIETLVRFLDENSDADVVYAAHTWIDAEGRPLEKVVPRPPEILVEHNCIGLAFLYRRRVMQIAGDYSVDHYLAEDYDFWFRTFMRCTMRPLNEDLLMIRRHGASLTDRMPRKVLEVTCRVVERHLPELWRTRPDVALRAETVLARRYLDLTESGRARRIFLSALGRHPLRVWAKLDGPRLPVTAFCGTWVAGRLIAARDHFRGGGRGVTTS